VFYVHTDQLNAPRRVTRPSDNGLRWRWDPTPFGEGAAVENPQSLGTFKYYLRFPGQYYDVETGLHYNYFRDYDPAVGRYVESDPIGLNGGSNTYSYVRGSPLSRFDVFGLSDREAQCKALRANILRKTQKLLDEFAKFDSEADAAGGHPMKYGSGITKPNGHRDEIRQLQQGLKNDIATYKAHCSDKGDWPGCPDYAKNLAEQEIPGPYILDDERKSPVPTGPSDTMTSTAMILAALAALGMALAF
jgi:RHS repeat-associated protein